MLRKMSDEIFRTIVLTLLAGVAVLVVALSNRNVYSKETVDAKLAGIEQLQETKYESLDKRVQEVATDVRWLVREWGGTPVADTGQSYHTSQPDSGQ